MKKNQRYSITCFLLLSVLLTSCSTNDEPAPIQTVKTQTINTKNHTRLDQTTSKRYHRVQAGENLYRISLKYKTSVANLARLNNISDPTQIEVGQLIQVPNIDNIPNRNKYTAPISSPKPQINNSHLTGMNFSWPVTGTVVTNFNGSTSKGLDIRVPLATPVKASQDGKVIYSDYVPGYGNLILISHNASNSILTAYGNNKDVMVKLNQQVKKGQVISTVGTNDSNQSVLHFEIRSNGKAINPIHYLSN